MEKLTKNQEEIVELVAIGYSIKEIAAKKFRADRTIVNQIQMVYEKIGVRHNLNALTAWYYCTKFNLEIDGTPIKNQIIAIGFLLLTVPSVMSLDDHIRRVKRSGKRSSKQEYVIEA